MSQDFFGDALWAVQCTRHFPSIDEQNITPYLRKFVLGFLDDILIFSKTPEEHKEHAKEVLEVLRNNNFLQNAASVNSTRQK